MKLNVTQGTIGQTIKIKLRDSAGAPVTGKTYADIAGSYIRPGEAAVTNLTPVTASVGTWTSQGFVEVDAGNAPGIYEFGIPNAALAGGFTSVLIIFQGSGFLQVEVELQLVGYDPSDGVRLGLTSLPNAAAAAVNGMLINGSNTGTVTLAALTVTGATTLTGNVSLGGTLGVTGTVTFNAFTVTNNMLVSGNFTVTGTTTHTGNYLHSGTTTYTGAVAFSSTFAVANTVTFNAFTVTNNLTVSNNFVVSGGFVVTGVVTLQSNFTVVGTTTLTGAVVFANNWTIQGNTVWNNALSGIGLLIGAGTNNPAVKFTGGTTGGVGLDIRGGSTTGDAVSITTTSGHGVNIAATGSSKHGLFVTGGTGGTSDGIKAVAGTGGVDIRGDLSATATAAIADKLLGRNLAGGSDGTRMVKDALRFLRNKWSVVGTTLVVCIEDDTTTAWTAALTVSAGATPITAQDPA